MHDLDQFVENLSDECSNTAGLCYKNNHTYFKGHKHRSRRSGKFSIQMLKIYDELAKYRTNYEKFVNNSVVSKGRPLEDV